ncbi:MAG: DUF2130 domain-containing protein [Bacteroidota bacterium]|nr:DUF2130 domain-containing protein [Bacteroidota bacterium]MDP4251831.1 DUF2130 domain-containing protein [Bacteroidota bacterium]
MSTIKCPNCQHEFAMEEAVSEQYKKDLREQMISFTRKKEEEFQQKSADLSKQLQQQQDLFNKKWNDEKKLLQQALEENLRKTISHDFENRLTMLQQSNDDAQEKLKLARQKELEFLQKEQELKNKEAELELSVQRKLQEEREKIAGEIRNIEEQKTVAKETEHQLRLKEKEKQLDDQKRLIEELQRKAEQGSMQLQGEVQELALETLLQASFPFDIVAAVGKGVRGADCTLTVRNQLGQECGKIIYESKRTKNFEGDWVDKLKHDMRQQGAHLAVLVTRVMPRDMECFGEKNGVWICSFSEVKALSMVLRDGIIRIFQAARTQQNKGDKMQLLYDYLTGTEFSEQWKAIREGFSSMKMSIQRERDTMEKLWKAREKQLEKVLLNAAHIKGSVEGIAGQDSISMDLLDESDEILGIE